MKLNVLLQGLTTQTIAPSCAESTVEQMTNDSRHIVSGCVFLAESGLSSHALDYLTPELCELATAIVYQPPYDLSRFAPYAEKFIAVECLNEKMSEIGQRFYTPQFNQSIIGITGTNGKTSISHFIAQLANYAVIGTMGYGRADALTELSHTTPNALLMQQILGVLSEQFDGVTMEVSSHALVLHRVSAVDFEVAVFSNLSQDHLDFHADMEDYFAAKATLFHFPHVRTAVINTDDDYGYRLAVDLQARGKRVLALGKQARTEQFDEYVLIREVQLSNKGILAELTTSLSGEAGRQTLLVPIWGEFNVYNVLSAMLALYVGGQSFEHLLLKAQRLKGVTGRMDAIDLGHQKTAIIDYAHTPDALASTLQSLQTQIRQGDGAAGKIYTVFGCGGDRDKSKRPRMAEAVNAYSDYGIITDDNPRTEKSDEIIADILTGDIERARFQVISSRREAIQFGLARLAPNDILLIAGKGHEDYQIIGTEKVNFSDYAVVQEWLNADV